MQTKPSIFILLIFLFVITLFGCDLGEQEQNKVDECVIKYPTDLVYLNNSPNGQVIIPSITPDNIKGYFRSAPENYDRLGLDPETGAINVEGSLSGLKYNIEFISTDKDTCRTSVTISGIGYKGSIFQISPNLTLAEPYYNANLNLVPPAGEYDLPSDNGITAGDIGLVIDELSGKINLTATAENIKDGSNNINGLNREFRVYYKLNDQSNKALNFIDLNIYLFNSEGNIPDYLKEAINDYENSPKNARTTARPRSKVIVIITK